ncbi:CHST1 [Mytilus edulis]|uniref:CHST1 n=1 Tax=Mytilus edulis TaxID=6550 RepID=A0A8S3PSQ6_MYTED|nr:CHST1 [Mytilus edulis]
MNASHFFYVTDFCEGIRERSKSNDGRTEDYTNDKQLYEGGTGGSLDDLSFPGDTLDDLAFPEGTGNSRNDVPFLEGVEGGLNDVTFPEGTGGSNDLSFPGGTGDISNGISVTERTDIQLSDIVNNNKYSSKVQPTAGDNFCNNSTCVLIVGYCRGGTTMALDVLSETDDSFALFEPISDLTLSSNLKVPVSFYNGTVRNITTITELPRVQAEMLIHWFNCDFTKINIGDLKKENLLLHSRDMRSYFTCLRHDSFSYCINKLEQVCLSKPRRIIKVIRLQVASLEHILKQTTNIKIIYLVRDPRATTMSMLKYKLIQSVVKGSEIICNKMMADRNATKLFKSVYPNNIFVLRYETLVQKPVQVFGKVFSFSNLPFTLKVDNYIKHHLLGRDQRNRSPWLTKFGNALRIANTWRTFISSEQLHDIDTACHRTYKAFGYRQLGFTSVRNLDVTLL